VLIVINSLGEKPTRNNDRLKRSQISKADFNLKLKLRNIPDNGLQLYRTSYAVRSATTTAAELLVSPCY